MSDNKQRVRAVADHPVFRKLVTFCVGMALFTLGVAYLNLGTIPEITTFMVVGGDGIIPGTTNAFRVTARKSRGGPGLSMAVTRVAINKRDAMLSSDGKGPVTVVAQVPATVVDKAVFEVEVMAEGRQATLQFGLPVREPVKLEFEDSPAASDTSSGSEKIVHRIDLLPEAGTMVLAMDNQVFVRVRSGSGEPVPKARVSVKHKLLPGGRLALTADESGLLRFALKATQPSLRLEFQVRSELGTSEHEVLLRPFGRKLQLMPKRTMYAPGSPIDVELRSWRDDAEIYCDVVQEGVWLESISVPVARRATTITLTPRPVGLYTLQCYDHALEPGESYATTPILVDRENALRAVANAAIERGFIDGSESTFIARGDDANNERYCLARMRGAPHSPRVLLSTRAGDLKEISEKRQAEKTRLLMAIAALFVVILLWVADALVRNVLETRRRLVAYTAELEKDAADDEDPTSTESIGLATTRGLLLVMVVGGTIVLNIIGLLSLLALIR